MLTYICHARETTYVITTTKIENYDSLILDAFIKYRYIGIYNDTFQNGRFLQ